MVPSHPRAFFALGATLGVWVSRFFCGLFFFLVCSRPWSRIPPRAGATRDRLFSCSHPIPYLSLSYLTLYYPGTLVPYLTPRYVRYLTFLGPCLSLARNSLAQLTGSQVPTHRPRLLSLSLCPPPPPVREARVRTVLTVLSNFDCDRAGVGKSALQVQDLTLIFRRKRVAIHPQRLKYIFHPHSLPSTSFFLSLLRPEVLFNLHPFDVCEVTSS